mgnify:CR=1 FL=1
MIEPLPPISPFKPQPVFNKTLLITVIAATACVFLIIGFFGEYYYFPGEPEKIIKEIIPPISSQLSSTSLKQSEENASSVQAQQNLPTVQPSANEINAQFLNTIDLNYQFTLKEYPETVFKILKITKAWGGVPIRGLRAPCNYLEQDKPVFIFIKDTGCQETTKLTDSVPSALVVIDLEINNNSSKDLYGRFLQLMYDFKNEGQIFQRLAGANPNWAGYGTSLLSSKRITIGFIIPETQNEAHLLYGNYGAIQNQTEGEDLLSKTINGLIIDFTNNTFSEIPG